MNHSDFLAVIEANPCDPMPRLVYADWLDDQGDPRGELLRIQEDLRHIDVPNRLAKEVRMHELLNAGVKPLMITRTNSIGMQEVLIFPGEFVMGSPEDEADHVDGEDQVEVILTHDFWLGRFPVTQLEWQHVMGNRPWESEDDVKSHPAFPARYVSWEDAVCFCRIYTERERQTGRLPKQWQYTLPSEVQCEYACRAGTTTRFFFGNQIEQLKNYAWFDENTVLIDEDNPHQVCEKLPNPWGLSDMYGNIWEWCRDYYHVQVAGGIDPEVTEVSSVRVLRGGAWHNSANFCGSADRDGDRIDFQFDDVGFRIARTLSK